MAATTLCSHSGELEIVQLYHGHGRKELLNTLTILQSFSVLFFERKSTTIYRLQGGKNTDRFRKPKWIWLLETLRILEKWMNLLNSMDLLNFIHPLFPTEITRVSDGQMLQPYPFLFPLSRPPESFRDLLFGGMFVGGIGGLILQKRGIRRGFFLDPFG